MIELIDAFITFYIAIVGVAVSYTVIWGGLGKDQKNDNKNQKEDCEYQEETKADELSPNLSNMHKFWQFTIFWKTVYILANFMLVFYIVWFAGLYNQIIDYSIFTRVLYYCGWLSLIYFVFSLRSIFTIFNLYARKSKIEYTPTILSTSFGTIIFLAHFFAVLPSLL